MKKNLLIAALTILPFLANAQFPYTVTTLTGQPYSYLTGGTNLTMGTIWYTQNYVVPLGFDFHIGIATVSDLKLFNVNAAAPATDTIGSIDGFSFSQGNLVDRGMLTNIAPLSPVSYSITGVVGARVVKLEYRNAGGYREITSLGTSDDSLNVQVWMYEGSNILEMHYGPSYVSHPDLLFLVGLAPGMYKGLHSDWTTFQAYYYLKGDPASPTVDSTHAPTLTVAGLTSYPPEGTVYRFTPTATTGVEEKGLEKQIEVFPIPAQDIVHISYSGTDNVTYTLLSLQGSRTGLEGQLQSGRTTIDISSLAKGIYILQCRGISACFVTDIVKL